MTTFTDYILLLAAVFLVIPLIALYLLVTNFVAIWRFTKYSQRISVTATWPTIMIVAMIGSLVFIFGWGHEFVEFIVLSQKKSGSRTFIFMFAPICIPSFVAVVALLWSIMSKRAKLDLETVMLMALGVPSVIATIFWVRTAFFGFDEAELMFRSLQIIMALLLVPAAFFLSPIAFRALLESRERRRRAEARGLQHPALLWMRVAKAAGPME